MKVVECHVFQIETPRFGCVHRKTLPKEQNNLASILRVPCISTVHRAKNPNRTPLLKSALKKNVEDFKWEGRENTHMVRPDTHPSVHTLQRLLGRVGYAPRHTRPCFPAPDTCRSRCFVGRFWKCMSRMGTVHCHLTLDYTNRDPSEAWLSPEPSQEISSALEKELGALTKATFSLYGSTCLEDIKIKYWSLQWVLF